MYTDRYSLKADARERLRAAAPQPYLEGLLYALVSAALYTLSMLVLFSKITPEVSEQYVNYLLSNQTSRAVELLNRLMPSSTDYLISLVLHLFQGIVAAGFTIYVMNLLREQECSLWNLLDGFGRFFPLLMLVLLKTVLTSLWTHLLIIPGILAAYRYRMALYLMLDHPELGSFQCLLLSGQVMRGHKLDLFFLDLSFLGWSLLVFLPPLLLTSFAGLVGLVVGAIISLAVLARLLPYYHLCCVGFYEAIKPAVLQTPPTDN